MIAALYVERAAAVLEARCPARWPLLRLTHIAHGWVLDHERQRTLWRVGR